MRAVLLPALFLFAPLANAQIVIQGTVKEAKRNKGIESVSITIQEKDNPAILGFTLTDEGGKYKIEYKGTKDSLIVSTSGFNVQQQSKTVARKNQTLNFAVNFKSIALQEVKITPSKIKQKGDTIDYTVSSFMDKNDRTIGDVLKKLPGIDVKESGQILYQSIPINKFYIEGLDLLQGRYGIATNNIEAKDVQSVQVLENHQAVKTLRLKVFSEQAAINLKLKESAKGVWSSTALLGAGFSPALWSGEVSASYFAKDRQNISTYKGNNTGNDISAEQSILYKIDAFQQPDVGLLSLQEPSSPSVISPNHYLFNRENTISFNNLVKISSDYQINTNVQYLNDRIDKSSFARTEYYLLRNYFYIDEKLNSRSYINQADAEMQLTANKPKFYLNNTLKLDGGWNNDSGNAITINRDSIGQQLDKPNYSVSNSFNLIKNYAKTAVKITSYNGYSTLPHTLTVQPVLYGDLFDSSGDFQAMRQQATLNRFSSITRISGGYKKGYLNQDYSLSFRADLRHLNSELTLQQPDTRNPVTIPTPDSLQNNLQWNKLEWIFSPQYTYLYNEWRVNVQLPLNYTYLRINDRSAQGVENSRRLFFNPTLQIGCKLPYRWNFYFNVSFSNGFGGIANEYTGYIMQTYRSLMRNEGELYKTQTQKYSLNLNYRDADHSFFGNAGITYTKTKANLLYGNNFKGILQVQKSFPYPNTTNRLSVDFSVNQAIDAIASTVRLSGSYSLALLSRLMQGKIFDVKQQAYSLVPEIITRVSSRAGFSYRFDYSESRSQINNGNGALKPIRTLSQKAQVNLFPIKNLTINLGCDYFHNSTVISGSRTMAFGDVGVKYKWNTLEFLLDYTNIFNSKQYITASYNEISSYYYAYDLRPAEVLLRVRFKLK